jgi:hypothetical protein
LFERIPQAALYTLTGVHRGLDCDFLGRPLASEPSGAHVQIFVVLADNHHVDVGRALTSDRRLHALVELDRPEIDVLLKIEAEPQQDTLFQDSGSHARVPYRAQEYGIAAPQAIHDSFGQNLSGGKVTLSAHIEALELEGKVNPPGHFVEDS